MHRPPPLKIISNEIAEIEVYNSFIISTINEGVSFDYEELTWFSDLLKELYPNQKIGYIANRIHKYSVNPLIYFEKLHYEQVSAIAVICNNQEQVNMALYEKTFYKKEFEIFTEIETAINWINEVV